MGDSDEKRISGGTFFNKFVLPAIWIGFTLTWTIGVSFFVGIQHRPPSPAVGAIGLVVFVVGLFNFKRYHFPLKQVWRSAEGLRISNFGDSAVIPYGAIEAIVQRTEINLRYVILTMNIDTPFGRRFTFLPTNPRPCWPFSRGEDEVVVELRERVKAARKTTMAAKIRSGLAPRPGRSPMADDQLDGIS